MTNFSDKNYEIRPVSNGYLEPPVNFELVLNYENNENEELYYSIPESNEVNVFSDVGDLSENDHNDQPDGGERFYDCDDEADKDDYIDDNELEYVYEPGINLMAMEFAKHLVEAHIPGYCLLIY